MGVPKLYNYDKIFKFLSWLFGLVAKWLEQKDQSILKHILPNISRSKGNQTIKFGQLIEYKIRNIFLEKSYTKCGGVTSPRPLLKLKLRISLDQ